MKSINKYMKGLFVAVIALCAGVAMTSCEDEPDKYEVTGGTPTVYYIRCLGSEIVGRLDTEETVYTNGQLVEEASPQSTLCLVGKNLTSIVEMWFNDKQAVLNSSYITNNTLIVDVPKDVPSEVTDKIYMITSDGDTVTFDFHVVISAPVLNSMSCEYAKPGSEVTITGQYMIDDPGTPLTVTFLDENGEAVEAEIKSISDDYTTIVVVVPETAAEGKVTVSSIYGATESTFQYMDTRGMVFDFDGGGIPMTVSSGKVGHGWHSVICNNDEWSISGAYMQLGNGSAIITNSTWDDSNFSFEYWPGNWKSVEDYADEGSERIIDVVDFSDWANMSLKFELCVPKDYPWSAGALQILPAPVTAVSLGSAGATDIYGNTLGGCNNVYIGGEVYPRAMYRPWTTEGTYDTGDEWITVTLPLSGSFLYGYSGSSATGSLDADSWSSLVFFLCGGGVEGTDCTPVLKIDNIRFVPNK